MADFANADEIIAARCAGDFYEQTFYKLGTASEAAGQLHSLWRDGGVPAAGSDGAAGSGSAGAGGTATDQEGISVGWGDQSPKIKRLITSDVRCSVAGTVVVYDRLVSVSAISINSTGTKNVNSTALTRYTDGVDVMPFFEVTTVSTAAAIISMNSYTNQAGTGTRAGGTVTFPAAATNVNTLVALPLQSGDYGVKSVETINVATSGAGTTAGNIVLLKELAQIPVAANYVTNRDLLSQVLSIPRIYDGASIMIAFSGTAASTPVVRGKLMAVFK